MPPSAPTHTLSNKYVQSTLSSALEKSNLKETKSWLDFLAQEIVWRWEECCSK
jgi:hypothetical protein